MHGTVCIGDAVNWDAPLNRGLVSWYLALPDQQRGNVLRDLCGRTHAPFTGATTDNAGPVGRAGGFGSLNRGTVNGSADTATMPQPVAVSCWCYLNTGGATNPRPWEFRDTNEFSWVYVSPNVQLRYGGGSGSHVTAAFPVATWVHLLATHDGTSVHGYINGLSAGSNAVTQENTAGAMQIGSGFNSAQFWTGFIDDVRCWNRHLIASEVASLYHASRQGYPEELNWTWPRAYVEQGGGGPATAFPWHHYYQQMMAG